MVYYSGPRLISIGSIICNLTIYLHLKDGKLTISGQDFSMLVEELFGDSEYEYFYALNQENTLLLAALLKGETFAEALVNYFSGLDGCKRFREFCDAHNIEYESHTYFG